MNKIITFDNIKDETKNLCEKIITSNFIPDVIIGIAKGGVIPATLIAYHLNIPTFKTIQIKSYNLENKKSDTIFSSGTLSLFDELNKYQNILIVDDLVDSGKTLQSFKQLYEYLKSIVNIHANIKFACIYYKETSDFKPDYYSKICGNEWLDFPWE